MNTIQRLTVAGLIALSSCLATAMQGEVTTPILAPGQIWIFAADSVNGQPYKYEPNLLLVGTPKPYGAASVGFLSEPVLQGATTFTDAFYYDPLDSDPEFVVATRSRSVDGNMTIQVCAVRNPVNQTFVHQTGLYKELGSTSVLGDEIKDYINTGNLTGQRTCTLTRFE